MQNEKVKKLKNLRSEPVKETGLAPMFQVSSPPPAAPKKEKTAKVDEARISFLISKAHDQEIKMYSARSGKKFKQIVIAALEQFFAEGATKKIENPHAMDGSGSKRTGVDVPVELKTKLDEYVSKEDVAMRFVVEGLISDYIQNN